MAGVLFTYSIQATPDANPRTMVQFTAAANKRALLHSIHIGPLGSSSPTDPLVFDLATQSSAGAGSSAGTAVKLNSCDTETIQTTIAKGFATEPTLGVVLHMITLHRQGAMVWVPPKGPIVIPGGTLLGFRSLNASAYVPLVLTFTLEE